MQRRRSPVCSAICLGLILTAVSLTMRALAVGPVAADVSAHGTTITVTQGTGDRRHGPRRHTPKYRDCRTVSLMVHALLPITSHFGQSEEVDADDAVAWRSCTRIADGAKVGWIVGLDVETAPPSASDLTGAAQSKLALPLPAVSTSPPADSTQLDGVPVWFWMDHVEPVSTTASVPGLSATLTATPTSARFTISDGTTLDCPDLGTPYDPGRPSATQHSDCTHTFDERGHVTVAATVDWALHWVASNGESGTLPPVAKSTTLDLNVEEGQAVTD